MENLLMSALTISKEDEKRVKGMGFLNNRGTDLFSARVLTVNGKVTAAQHHCMADAAEKFGNGNLLYTTRLSVEIQGIPYDKIEEFQEFIAKEGLVTGGTGAKVRPVVSCKGTTCQYGLLDSYALSEEIYRRFYEGFQDVALPHKFKIAVGGCPNNCVKPNLNDDSAFEYFCCSGGLWFHECSCNTFIFISANGKPGDTGTGKTL